MTDAARARCGIQASNVRCEKAHPMTTSLDTFAQPNDLQAYWMPYTANRSFKQRPRLLVKAKGMVYTTDDGRSVIDGTAGLWCSNAGHGREPIVAAIQAQAAELDFASPFQSSHPKAFTVANRIAALAPGDLDHVFFANSGSEAVDTALKIALAYHKATGNGSRQRLIGRERGYHGCGFGGRPSAAWSPTARPSACCSPASITCRRPTIAPSRPSRSASRPGAAISRRTLSVSSRCTTLRRSRPSSSSR